MASSSVSRPPPQLHHINWSTSTSTSTLLPKTATPYHGIMPLVRAINIAHGGGSDQVVYGPDLLRKPVVSLAPPPENKRRDDNKGGPPWMDWEDQILTEIVPLVGFVRMILHSGKYKPGDRLSPDHDKIIVERLLPFHPKYQQKIGCGIDHIMVGYHPDFEGTRCLLIVKKDGEMVDFSYWKCIKGLIKKKYPLHADTFILRHFRRQWRRD